MAILLHAAAPVRPSPNARAVAVAVLLLAAGAAWLGAGYGWRQGALYLVGGALGVCLYHAAFGFTSAWRALLADGRGEGLRAQMAMLAIATAVFLPVLSNGTFFGRPVGGAVANAGTSVAMGALLFGIGMQLSGGCASGTLFSVGAGSARMAVTLVFFVLGSVVGTLHAPWWYAQPGFGAVSLVGELGLVAALAVQLGLFALIWWGSLAWERRRLRNEGHHLEAEASPSSLNPPLRGGGNQSGAVGTASPPIWRRRVREGGTRATAHGLSALPRAFVFGPWPLLWGAVGLALLNVLTLYLAGHPWSITFAFSLWGAKALAASGIDVAAWEYWTWPYPAGALKRGVLADVTSVMNFGIVLGALLAAGLSGRLAPLQRIPARPLVAAIVGGLLLGYGARLAFGCNIGAFFSGVASGSLHGWLWLVAALAGNWIGVRLRPAFGLGR